MIGNAAAARLTGQNVRGLTTLKLEKLVQFMKEQRLLLTCLMETWRVTKQGLEIEEIDGFLIIHHGESAKSCNRGRNGVYGRSLQRHLAHFNLPAAFTEWAPLAQDRAGWRKLVTEPPFKLGKPCVRQPRGDTRVTPEDKHRAAEQRAAEIAKRRADFNATNN